MPQFSSPTHANILQNDPFQKLSALKYKISTDSDKLLYEIREFNTSTGTLLQKYHIKDMSNFLNINKQKKSIHIRIFNFLFTDVEKEFENFYENNFLTNYCGSKILNSKVKKGFGTVFDKEGLKIYRGSFSNNKYNGNGKFFSIFGNVLYSGDFLNNLFNGFGKYFDLYGKLKFIGNFVNGFLVGNGTEFDARGNIVYDGKWRKNEYFGKGELYVRGQRMKLDGVFECTGVLQKYAERANF